VGDKVDLPPERRQVQGAGEGSLDDEQHKILPEKRGMEKQKELASGKGGT